MTNNKKPGEFQIVFKKLEEYLEQDDLGIPDNFDVSTEELQGIKTLREIVDETRQDHLKFYSQS